MIASRGATAPPLATERTERGMAGFVAFAIRNSRDTVLIAAAATKDEAMALEAQRILKLVAAREIDGLTSRLGVQSSDLNEQEFALLAQTVDTFFDEKFPS